mgnify:CR=1 FL=1
MKKTEQNLRMHISDIVKETEICVGETGFRKSD